MKNLKKSTYIIILLVVIIIFLLFALIGKSSNSNNNVQPNSTSTQSNSTQNTSSSQPTMPKGSEVTLGTGHYTVGKKIQPGLYNICILKGQGSIDIRDSSGEDILNPLINAHPNPNPQNQLSVNKIRVFLTKGDTISLQGVSEVKFEPTTLGNVTSPKKETLYTGVWKVGQDIAPGKYIINNNLSADTDVFVYHADGSLDYDFDLSAAGSPYDGAISTYTGSFEKGEIIVIGGSQGIDFIPSK